MPEFVKWKDRKYGVTSGPFNTTKNMVLSKDVARDARERRKRWITFYRRNPAYFVRDYFGITLYPYQNLMLWVLQRSKLGYIVAARASAKTFMIAIWATTLCVLYPGIKVIVVSKTIKQAGLILSEKLEYLMKNYPNVRREIEDNINNANTHEAIFYNGSSIKIVPASESARGNRANYVIVEESRLVSKEILDAVIKPFLEVRTPPYRSRPEYDMDERLIEEGILTSITSAGWKNEQWYKDAKHVISKMVEGDPEANFLAFDYLISLHHNIKTKKMLKNEMEDSDIMTVQMEYLNIPAGSSGKSYFKIRMFPKKIKKAWYPQRLDNYNPRKNPYDIRKSDGEIRIVSVDIAARAGKANDNTIISCARLIPMVGVGYKRQLVYMESHKGENTLIQAKRIKEIFFDFLADYVVLDLAQAGIGIFDNLSQLTMDEERGIEYDPMTVVDEDFEIVDRKLRDELRTRTLGVNAQPVIFPIVASQALNSHIATSFRNSLKKKLWEFLIGDVEAEDFLIKNEKDFAQNLEDSDMRAFFLNPFIQCGLFISECINLDMMLYNGMIKLTEKSGAYKDRYSSVSYMNWIVSEVFDPELLKQSIEEDELDILSSMTIIVN